MAWWIKEWSRDLGRGRIEGTRADALDFDASIALVDDFQIGEEVHVELERQGETWRVTKIQPDDPRFVAREPVAEGTPALETALERTVQTTLDQVRLQEAYRLSKVEDGMLILCGEEGYAYPPPSDAIILSGVSYIELPNYLEIKMLRLSRSTERDYLATRVDEFSSSDVALTVVDVCRRIYFVVCEGVKYRKAGEA